MNKKDKISIVVCFVLLAILLGVGFFTGCSHFKFSAEKADLEVSRGE